VNERTLEKVCAEISAAVKGERFGKVFVLSRFQITIDFRLPDTRYLFISIEPTAPRIYLIKRRLKDLERQSGTPSAFALALKKRLSGATMYRIEKISDERVLRLEFSGHNELGADQTHSLIVQITGRSANLFLLGGRGYIIDTARDTLGTGQQIGDLYATPSREGDAKRKVVDDEAFPSEGFKTLSEALDVYHLEKDIEKRFQSKVSAARSKLKQDLTKLEKLAAKLRSDLEDHGDAEKWKRTGDLLLANIGTARREGESIFVTDFYDEAMPEVELKADVNLSVTEAAEKFFKRYTKARNAGIEIAKRLQVVTRDIENKRAEQGRMEAAIAERDEELLAGFAGERSEKPLRGQKKNKAQEFTGARHFSSSEGFEILVGKVAKDNDFLTFRVAKSYDLWMHAADYPGSHVVVKNPNRQEIPPKTLLEAAQIAAFYSHAREQPKVAVHYTQRKFVNKPKGANPGLVSLASFKTILVEPKIGEAQNKEK
jgi:predicted ribosome quality control (RQC) complex YloA/Tae2 family protein